MKSYVDRREGKVAVYVMDETAGLVIHSGQHDTEEAALKAVSGHVHSIIGRTQLMLDQEQRSLAHWTSVYESLSTTLTPRER